MIELKLKIKLMFCVKDIFYLGILRKEVLSNDILQKEVLFKDVLTFVYCVAPTIYNSSVIPSSLCCTVCVLRIDWGYLCIAFLESLTLSFQHTKNLQHIFIYKNSKNKLNFAFH